MASKKSRRKNRPKRKVTRKKSVDLGREINISAFLDKFSTYDKIAIGVVILALAIRLFFYPHCFWIDESREMAVARNLMRGNGQTLYGQYYIQHPYVFYTLVGISTLIFGTVDFAGIIVSVITSTLTIGALYLLGKEVYSELTGLIAALFLTFHPLHMFYSVRVINDVTVVFFIVASMYFFVRFNRRKEWTAFYAACALAALAMLTKMIAIILPPLMILYILFKKRLSWIKEKRYWYGLGVFMIFFGIYMIVNVTSIGELFPFSYYFGRFSPGGVDVQPFTYYFENFIAFVRIPLTLLFFWGFLCTFLIKFRNSRYMLLWIVLFLLLISAQADKVDRYILPIIPQICVIAGFGMEKIVRDFKKRKYVSYGFIAILCIWTTYLFYTESSVLIPALSTGFCGFKETGDWLKINSQYDDPLMIGSDNQIAWYADRENLYYFPPSVPEFYEFINSTRIRYLVVDRWERTQPDYVFKYTEEGVMFWYPNFLDDPRFPIIDVIMYGENPATFIYRVLE